MTERTPAVNRCFKTEKMGGQVEHVKGRDINATFQDLFLVKAEGK